MHYNLQTRMQARTHTQMHTLMHTHTHSNEIQHIRETEVAREGWTEVGQNLDTLKNKVKRRLNYLETSLNSIALPHAHTHTHFPREH